MATPSDYQQTLLNPTKTTKTTKKFIFSFLTLATLISLVYLSFFTIQSNYSYPNNNNNNLLSLCEKSHHPTSCLAFINEAIPNEAETTSLSSDDGRKMVSKLLSLHASDITKAMYVTKRSNNNVMGNQAIVDCLELMDLSRDRLENSIKKLATNYYKGNFNYDNNNDIKTWLSAVLTNHVTCLDQMEDNNNNKNNNKLQLLGIKSLVEDLILRSRALLAIHSKVSSSSSTKNLGKKIMKKGIYPSWVKKSDRKLLEVSGSNVKNKADLVVAKDGSGNFTTVGEALAAAPDRAKTRYIIYVKQGVYVENVEVGKKKKNVMLVGDGMTLTIITGSENVVDGNTTFKSATLAAVGDGFILQDIRIENTAGPEKHQAVALRTGTDQAVINRCYIDAFQDTLYTHSLRQFFTDSTITGTVDFIFGNSAVVFQNCQIVARKPMTSQKNMVTAQGRTDPNQNTGTSIQYSDIVPSEDLAPVATQFPTFLGRPWKEYSRTVVLQSNIGGHVDPAGWFPWDGDFALSTLYYGEYMNHGAGSDTSKRVNWTGYHVITDPIEAKQFTVGEFIQGQEWLDATGVNFDDGL